jgi:hypothetical protein
MRPEMIESSIHPYFEIQFPLLYNLAAPVICIYNLAFHVLLYYHSSSSVMLIWLLEFY